MNWKLVSDELPEVGVMVLGFSTGWIHEDYNPAGLHECFLMDDGFWTFSRWNNSHDCWDTVTGYGPEKWLNPVELIHA